MKVSNEELEILNHLVGTMDEEMASVMKDKIDFFLHDSVSLFVPSSGQCEYAIQPSHTHPSYTFIYYFQSIDNFIVEGRKLTYEISDGKCITAISPDIPHQELPEEYFQSYIAIAIEKKLFEDTIHQYVSQLPVFRGEIYSPHPELLGLLRCFMLEAGETVQTVHKRKGLLKNLAGAITHYMVRSLVLDIHRMIPLYDRFEVDRAIAYMNSHFFEHITLEELAAMVNLSVSHFSKVFKTVTGESPIDFLKVIRLKNAKRMLMKNMSNITEIAIQCGFNSSSYFSACFLEKYKMTPSAYRQNVLNAEKPQNIDKLS